MVSCHDHDTIIRSLPLFTLLSVLTEHHALPSPVVSRVQERYVLPLKEKGKTQGRSGSLPDTVRQARPDSSTLLDAGELRLADWGVATGVEVVVVVGAKVLKGRRRHSCAATIM